MKIAITCGDSEVFQHFGRTPEFAVFEIGDGKIKSQTTLSSGELGHGALVGLLTDGQIQVLICGGIGGGAVNALAEAGIRVIGGASGKVRKVAEDFAAGILQTNPNFSCNHHHEGGDHECHCH